VTASETAGFLGLRRNDQVRAMQQHLKAMSQVVAH
jgi:hypothetical protein